MYLKFPETFCAQLLSQQKSSLLVFVLKSLWSLTNYFLLSTSTVFSAYLLEKKKLLKNIHYAVDHETRKEFFVKLFLAEVKE